MNSKEFEILNEKMDMIFEAIENMRREEDYDNQKKREESLKSKLEDAQRDLDWAKENRERIDNYHRDVKNNYYSIKENVERRYEYRMKDAIEKGIGMHTPIGPMEEKI